MASAELTSEQVEELRQDLIELKRSLTGLVELAADGARPIDLDESIGRLSRMDAIQQREMARANLDAHRLRLNQVSEALDSIADGTFGQCIWCEQPIPYRRLKALPDTATCLPCQEQRETS